MTKLIHFALSLVLFISNPVLAAAKSNPMDAVSEKWNQARTFKEAMLELHKFHPTVLGDELIAAIPEKILNPIRLKIEADKVEISTKDKKFVMKADSAHKALMLNDQIVQIEHRTAQQVYERIFEIVKDERHAFNFSLFPEAQAQAIVMFPAFAYEQLRQCIDSVQNEHSSTLGKAGSCVTNVISTDIAFSMLLLGDFIFIGMVGVFGTVFVAKEGYAWLSENMPKTCRAHFEDMKKMKPNPNGYTLSGLSCRPEKLMLARNVNGKVETKTVEPKGSGLACDEHNCFKFNGERSLVSVEIDGKEIKNSTSSEADIAVFAKMRQEWDLLSRAVDAYQKAGFCTCLKYADKKTFVPVQGAPSAK